MSERQKPSSAEVELRDLSPGECADVRGGAALARHPKLIILDEPTGSTEVRRTRTFSGLSILSTNLRS